MLLKSILDFLFPRYCEMCGERLFVEEDIICETCNNNLPRTYMWLKDPWKRKQYRPDDIFFKEKNTEIVGAQSKTNDNPLSNNALAQKYYGRIEIERAISFLKFVSKSQTAQLVYAFKYHNKKYVANSLGKMMAKEILPSGFFDGIDYIIPTPITFRREYKRGYNQSEELAKGISKHTGIKIENRVIKRVSFKQSQTKLNAQQRQENVNGVFELTSKSSIVQNKHILLIDDVITTGATTLECCKVLKKIQGTKISILSLGMVTII